MKVVCIDADGEPELTFGMVYRLECFYENQAKLDRIDAKFDRQRFIIIELEHDAECIPGTTVSLQTARTLGLWPGQIRRKNCPCDFPPGKPCEYHGP